jgi:hypothetical protein
MPVGRGHFLLHYERVCGTEEGSWLRENIGGLSRARCCRSLDLPGASADRYTLVNVADSTGAFSAVGGAPTINNAGVITFLGFKSDGSSGIYTGGNGGPISLVADTSGPIASFRQTPIINDNGLVAFRATRKAGGFGIYTAAPGGPLNLIAGESATLTTGGEPVLNDAGTVAFRATTNNVTGI